MNRGSAASAIALIATSCYSRPSTEGLPCDDDVQCDQGQSCVAGVCAPGAGETGAEDSQGDGDSVGDGDGTTSVGDGDGTTSVGDGDGTTSVGDGDGDGTTGGDGDGDGTTGGDGDGDGTTGGDGDGTSMGDGDGTTSVGDGDGDGTSVGDGDGDGTTSVGDGDGDGTTSVGDGDGDGTTSVGDGDGDGTTSMGDGDGDGGGSFVSTTSVGDGDGDGDGDVCDPFNTCTDSAFCDVGERCVFWDCGSGTYGSRVCVPETINLAPGAACSPATAQSSDDCQPDTWCDPTQTLPVCKTMCYGHADCGDNEYCDVRGSEGGVCELGCQPFTRPCTAPGEECVPIASGVGWRCVLDSGTGLQGEGCATADDCDLGLVCESLCAVPCEIAGLTCAAGQLCSNLADNYGSDYDGVVGYCSPPADLHSVTIDLVRLGSVADDLGVMTCDSIQCTGEYVDGIARTFTADPGPGHFFVQWIGGPCAGSSNPVCFVTVSGPLSFTAEFSQSRNIAFFTSTTIAPTAGGSAADFDAECQARADAVGFPGSYLAYVGTDTQSAMERMGTASGWVRADGRAWANSLADLEANWQQFYPLLTELGDPLGPVDLVWTGANGGTCGGWSSDAGLGDVAYGERQAWWGSAGFTSACNGANRIACLGTDLVSVSMPPPVGAGARMVFRGSADMVGSVASLDVRCTDAAGSAGLTGSYVALVATSTASMGSRLDPGGGNWVRPDGAEVAATPADFIAGNWINNIAITAAGNHDNNSWSVWTGATDMTALGGAANCLDWSSGLSAWTAIIGTAGSVVDAVDATTATCNSTASLYCAQL